MPPLNETLFISIFTYINYIIDLVYVDLHVCQINQTWFMLMSTYVNRCNLTVFSRLFIKKCVLPQRLKAKIYAKRSCSAGTHQ